MPGAALPRRRSVAALLTGMALVLTGCAGSDRPSVRTPPGGSGQLRVSVVASGLEIPWDVGFLPDGRILATERAGRLVLLSGGSPSSGSPSSGTPGDSLSGSATGTTVTPVAADLADVYAQGEGGLMGLVVHPDFAKSHRFTTCQTHADSGTATDVRLVTWQLSPDGTSATRLAQPLVTGLPINPSGRHSGCRPIVAPDGALMVGTGDTARGNLAQDRTSLGGKTLRIDLATGGPAAGNPFADAANPATRLIWTFGHRNVQGITVRPGTGEIYTAEHGPSTDDEVNRLRPGGNYGWDPSQGGTVGGYDESVPMTDLKRFPDAVPAVWSSGSPVEAISGLAFISGPQWGALDGTLAVAALRGEKLLLMTLAPDGTVASTAIPPELNGPFGRLRAARTAPDGALYLTTSNGTDDKILRITPS